jgi:flavin reductase (DIM6/NTAB) family NADH-FMN oxidoreductase RutF
MGGFSALSFNKGGFMYKNLKLDESIRIINAGSVVLLCAQSGSGKTVTPVAWNMPVNDEPPIAAAALDSSHFITKLILESKEFCICIPGMEILETVLRCGSVTGKEKDKFAMFNIKYEKCEKINSIKVTNCAGYLECRLKDDFKYSGVDLIIADVVSASAKEELYDGSWITGKFKSIHSVGNMFGASLGERFKFWK